MAEASQPPRNEPWTGECVERRLVEAFRAGQIGRLAAEAMTWPARYVVADPEARAAILEWAHAKANGHHLEDLCRIRGVALQTFRDRRKRAAAAIADGLNQDGTPHR